MLVLLLKRKCMNFGFHILLLISVMGFGFILNFFFLYDCESGFSILVFLFTSEYVNFGLNMPLPILIVGFGFIFKGFFFPIMDEDPI